MLVYGLRLLVALITFGVGVAASALLSSESRQKAPCGKRIQSFEHVTVLQRRVEAPQARPMTDHLLPEVEAGILNGKVVSKPKPAYPPALRSANVKGTVVVRVRIGTDGSVVSAEAVSGPVLLRGVSEAAALRATFTPTLISGEPVSVRGLLTYNFGLE